MTPSIDEYSLEE